MYLLIKLLHKMQEEQTCISPSKAELCVATHKKKNSQSGQHDTWVEQQVEKIYVSIITVLHFKKYLFHYITYNSKLHNMIFFLQGKLEKLRGNQVRSQSDSAGNPPWSDDDLLLEAVGGVYKNRAYKHGSLPPRPHSVYAVASSLSSIL